MTGFTKDEKMLFGFGRVSFLQMWTWPNLFRDQGKTSSDSDGKEICDLTVIFGNDVILFSDKRIVFNENKNIEVAWSRWVRRAIHESLKQLQGAERWLTTNSDRVYIDKACKKRLPITLPTEDKLKFLRIVVTHGLEQQPEISNNEGSLSFSNQLHGAENWDQKSAVPFTIGLVSETDFIHVFTDATIKQVLSEFDTAEDFISYLEQRESLFRIAKPVTVSKESDIIHLFYENYVDEEQSRIILSASELSASIVNIRKEPILKLYENPSFLYKRQADTVSYFWDNLIESFAFHALNGTSLHTNWEHTSEMEPALRVMAAPGRFDRRVLSQAFMDFYYKARPGQRGTRVFYNPSDATVGYLFLLLPYIERNGSPDSYRELRNQMLHDYTLIYGGMHKELASLVGIAVETRTSDESLASSFFNQGQDYIYMDCNGWTPEMVRKSEELRARYENHGLIAKRSKVQGVAHEFPTY